MIKLKHQSQRKTSGTLKQSSKQRYVFLFAIVIYASPHIEKLETNQNNIVDKLMIKLRHQSQRKTSGTLKQSSKQRYVFLFAIVIYASPHIEKLETNQNNISTLLS